MLTTAEKTALATLILLLAGGAALRAWERAGVKIGPVDDWESLRRLVIGAREKDAGRFSCDDAAAANRYASFGPRDAAPEEGLALAAGMSFGQARGRTSSGGGKKAGPTRPVDLNTAGEKALLSLPGVGPSTAKAILAHRAARGPFTAVEDLMQIKGIGPKKLETIRPFVRVISKDPPENPKAATKTEDRAEDGADDGVKTGAETPAAPSP